MRDRHVAPRSCRWSWRRHCSPWRACRFFAGFVSKFYLFTAVAAQGLLWLAGLAIFTSLISLYYYLQVMRQMYIEEPRVTGAIRVPRVTVGLLGVLLVGMVLVGVLPGTRHGCDPTCQRGTLRIHRLSCKDKDDEH